MINVTKSSMPSFDEYCEEIKDIWESQWLTNMGVKHKQLEQKLSVLFQCDSLQLFCNGHMALELTLQALELQGEVITTPFTFASTTHSIVRNGLKPVFCDIKSSDFTIDEAKIEALITENTCAIMPVHVYGNICNVEEIQRIAEKYSLKVIYDAAHAFGELYHGKSVAAYGDVSCFSFHATKVFNTIEGGAAVFNNPSVSVKSQKLKNFGIWGPECVEEIGANAKMNEFSAAMGICNLRHLDDNIARRKAITQRYIENLYDVRGLKLNLYDKGVQYNYSYFPIVIDEMAFGKSRDALYDKLEENGVYARKYFYPLTSDFACYQGVLDHGNTPVADYVASSVLTLPIYPDLPLETVDYICKMIKE